MSEILAASALVFAGLAVLAGAIFVRGGRTHDGRTNEARDGATLSLLQVQISDLARSSAAIASELRTEVQQTLIGTEQRVGAQVGATQRTLSDLGAALAQLSERSDRIGELAREIGSLHDLLRLPQPRGGFGELLLERLLADNLPADAFDRQYSFRDGSRVDAVVRLGGRIVPIDAKFPLDAYQAMSSGPEEERPARRRAFLQQVRRHVDAVSRYVKPDEGTIDVAMLYVPAEQLYYHGFVVSETTEDMRAYCSERRVVPVSPNTLVAYLQLVSLGLRGLAIEQRSREMHDQIRRAAMDLQAFTTLYDQLGKHIDNASKKFTESLRALDRATDAVETLGQTQLAAPAQPTLALDLANGARPGNGHGSRVGTEERS